MGIKQIIKRCLAIGLVSMLLLNPILAQSSNDGVNRTLTLDKVIESAMNREDKAIVLNKQINAYKEKLNNVSDISSMAYSTVKYSYDQALLEQETLKDTVAYKAMQLYESIVILQKQIELSELDIEIAKKELLVAQIKNNKGQLSKLSLSQAKYNVDNEETKKKQNELLLADYKSQLLSLTNINLDDYDNLEEDLSYNTLGEEKNINGIIMKNVDYYMKNTEAYVAYQQDHIVEALEYKYGTNTGITMDMWEGNKADLAQNSYNAEKQRKQMVESLKTTAVELKKLEETIVLQETQFRNMQEEFKAVEINYSKGYVSELDKQKAEQGMQQLELARMQNLYTHKQLKMVFEKPWVKY